jgi:hypothetical protein
MIFFYFFLSVSVNLSRLWKEYGCNKKIFKKNVWSVVIGVLEIGANFQYHIGVFFFKENFEPANPERLIVGS